MTTKGSLSPAAPEEQKKRSLRHDLLTPMNHIMGFSEMLVEEASGAALASLEEIHGTGKHLLSLVTNLFDASGTLIGTPDACVEIYAAIDRIANQSDALLENLTEAEHGEMAPDLRNIKKAAGNLLNLINGIPALSAAAGADVPSPEVAPSALPDAAPLEAEATARVVRPARAAVANNQGHYGPLLVVDDNESNREMLSRRLLRLGYTVHIAEDGLAALKMMGSAKFDLVLLDVMMPGLDGYEVLQRMKSDDGLRDIPVIMISALQEIESIVRCIELGAEDYLPKPFDPVLLRARVGASLEKKRLRDQEVINLRQIEKYNLHLEELVREQVRDISRAQIGTIFALSNLAESRDPETGEHLTRVQHYCKALAQQLGTRPKYAGIISSAYVETLVAASPLHDIGKVGIPDNILQKPGKLTDDEFEIMKQHTTLGAATLRAVEENHAGNAFIQMGIEVVESHHEKWNGSGYPYGLAGEAIPLSGRILALADVYDALRSKRCYKDGFSHEKTREIILEGRDKHFDPDIVDCFLETEEQFQMAWMQFNQGE